MLRERFKAASLALRAGASRLQGHTRVNETQLAYRHTLASTSTKVQEVRSAVKAVTGSLLERDDSCKMTNGQ